MAVPPPLLVSLSLRTTTKPLRAAVLGGLAGEEDYVKVLREFRDLCSALSEGQAVPLKNPKVFRHLGWSHCWMEEE